MVYVQDDLEIVIGPNSPLLHNPHYYEIIDKYAYINGQGQYILSWDLAKYVNHCCHYNTLSTAYGFDIAVRDIAPAEEITCEYALFNLEEAMDLTCPYPDCRQKARPEDLEQFCDEWDQVAQHALQAFDQVPQPLLPYLNSQTYAELRRYLQTGQGYRSLHTLKYHPPTA